MQRSPESSGRRAGTWDQHPDRQDPDVADSPRVDPLHETSETGSDRSHSRWNHALDSRRALRSSPNPRLETPSMAGGWLPEPYAVANSGQRVRASLLLPPKPVSVFPSNAFSTEECRSSNQLLPVNKKDYLENQAHLCSEPAREMVYSSNQCNRPAQAVVRGGNLP